MSLGNSEKILSNNNGNVLNEAKYRHFFSFHTVVIFYEMCLLKLEKFEIYPFSLQLLSLHTSFFKKIPYLSGSQTF